MVQNSFGCIVATALQTPKISIGSSRKVKSYADSWPEDNFPYDVSAKALPEAVEHALSIRENDRAKIAVAMAEKAEAGIAPIMKCIPSRNMSVSSGAIEATAQLESEIRSNEADRLRQIIVEQTKSHRKI